MARFPRTTVYAHIESAGVLPVLYTPDLAQAQTWLQAAYGAGYRAFEFTNRGENAFALFSELLPWARHACPDLALGIGTVLDGPTAGAYLLAGADFVVSPTLCPDIAPLCHSRGVAWIPGAATPTEVASALALGAELVKVFPATVLTPVFVKAVLGPLPNVRLLATGGIQPTEASMGPWFAAGTVALGIGEALLGPGYAPDTPLEALTATLRQALALVARLRP